MIKEAVARRIVELCDGRGISTNALANISGIDPSTIYSILGSKSQNPGIVTIKMICDGLDISIAEFFDADVFRNLEQELK
ncbi:transcriptional regulator [Clostridia bacterium]|nr:transcriptional regulator [Clostridia bacterium]